MFNVLYSHSLPCIPYDLILLCRGFPFGKCPVSPSQASSPFACTNDTVQALHSNRRTPPPGGFLNVLGSINFTAADRGRRTAGIRGGLSNGVQPQMKRARVFAVHLLLVQLGVQCCIRMPCANTLCSNAPTQQNRNCTASIVRSSLHLDN